MDNHSYLFLDSAQISIHYSFVDGYWSTHEYDLEKFHLHIDYYYLSQPIIAANVKVSYFTHKEIEPEDSLTPRSSCLKKDLIKSRHFTRDRISMLHHILSKLSPEPSEANLQLAVDLGLFDIMGHVGS